MDPANASPDQPQGPSTEAAGPSDAGAPVVSGRSIAYALGAGFGLTLVVIAIAAGSVLGGITVALGAGLLLGRVYLGRRWAAFVGLILGVLGWMVAANSMVAPAPSEWGGLAGFAFAILFVAFSVVTGVGLLIGGFAPSHPSPDGALARLVGATGLVALAALTLTFGVLIYAPASASFEFTLPPGWHILSPTVIPWRENIQFGGDYTAVYGSTEPPTAMDVPVVGVTTVRGYDGSPSGCYGSMDTWSRPASPLYDGTIVSTAETELPVGPAHYEVRAGDQSGSAVRVHGYGIARERMVGVLPERICYIVAITVPPGGAITEGDARAIADSFRFR